MRRYDCRSCTPYSRARRFNPLMAACKSLASVGKVTFLGCTVASTVTRARSRLRSAPLAWATRRLSANSSSSLSPSRLRQWLRSERSCGNWCWKNSSPVKCFHHREVHRAGDERAWWQEARIDPVGVARTLWGHTRLNEGAVQAPHGGEAVGPSVTLPPDGAPSSAGA